MPVRRLHNFVYCPRLFYLQWIENIFVPNEDTVLGSALHKSIDEPTKLKQASLLEEGGTLRSVSLTSDTLQLTGIAHVVGLDPFLGFFHSPRYGRPALALDMMEEFRPLIADSTVLSLINRGEITIDDFVSTTHGVILKDSARRQFWRAWTRRLDTEVTHPHFLYKMSYRRMLSVQMQQLWRFCRNDIATFHPFTTR